MDIPVHKDLEIPGSQYEINAIGQDLIQVIRRSPSAARLPEGVLKPFADDAVGPGIGGRIEIPAKDGRVRGCHHMVPDQRGLFPVLGGDAIEAHQEIQSVVPQQETPGTDLIGLHMHVVYAQGIPLVQDIGKDRIVVRARKRDGAHLDDGVFGINGL